MKSGTKKSSIAEILVDAAEILTAQGIINARLDAEVLLAHTLGITRTALLTRLRDFLSEADSTRFLQLLHRRLQREPLQYITRVQEFWSLEFHVTPDVLIPRAETELLVETALGLGVGREKRLQNAKVQTLDSGLWTLDSGPHPLVPTIHNPQSTIRILDVGTGSGCIAIALATELPQAEIWATDISNTALVLALENAQRHKVADRVHFLQGDLFAPLHNLGLTFDLIVSNPPYIAQNDILNLQPEVQEWEPHRALDGGKDGLDFYRRLLQEIPCYLQASGWLVMEIGHDQGESVLHLAQQRPELTNSACLRDYEGRERIVLTQKTPEKSTQK